MIIKSLMSPDSAESILLSYLISICIMPPVSQSLHFRGQGVGSKLQKTIFFFCGGHNYKKRNTSHSKTSKVSPWVIDESLLNGSQWWLRNQPWLSDSLSEDIQPASLHIFICGDVGGWCGDVGGWCGDYSGSAEFLQHRTGLCGTTRTLWIMSSLCDVCCRG